VYHYNNGSSGSQCDFDSLGTILSYGAGMDVLRCVKAWGKVMQILCQKYGDMELIVSEKTFEICMNVGTLI
jgi:hypothetical protein